MGHDWSPTTLGKRRVLNFNHGEYTRDKTTVENATGVVSFLSQKNIDVKSLSKPKEESKLREIKCKK